MLPIDLEEKVDVAQSVLARDLSPMGAAPAMQAAAPAKSIKVNLGEAEERILRCISGRNHPHLLSVIAV